MIKKRGRSYHSKKKKALMKERDQKEELYSGDKKIDSDPLDLLAPLDPFDPLAHLTHLTQLTRS